MNQTWLARLLARKQASGRTRRIAQVGTLLVWLGCLAVVGWIGWYDRNTIIPYLVQADYLRLSSALGGYIASLVAVLIGWSAIMRSFAGPLNWWTHAQIYCATLAARRLPGTLWYIGGRLVLYKRLCISRTLVSLASGVELVVSIVTGGLVGLVLLPFGLSLYTHLIVFLVGGVVAGILTLHPVTLRTIMKWIGKPLTQAVSFKDTLVWLLAYSAMWVMSGMMVGQIIGAFEPVGLREMVLIIGAWALSGTAGMLTFFLPSGLGVTELTLAVLLSQIMPLPLAAFIALLTRILITLFEVSLSVIFYAVMKHSADTGI